jgi:hypothetical protein
MHDIRSSGPHMNKLQAADIDFPTCDYLRVAAQLER